MNLLKHIPNTITCGNLLCGTLAVIQIFNGQLQMACYLVMIAAVLDFFDGFMARILKVSSPIGKDLDSLADLVTFGLVPGLLMHKLLIYANTPNVVSISKFITEEQSSFPQFNSANNFVPYLSLLIPILSAVRLARFNHDTRQTGSFIGLPTPSLALFVTSGVLYLGYYDSASWLVSNWLFISLTVLLSLLLNAEIPLFALKFKSFDFKGNEIRYSFLLVSAITLLLTGLAGISIAILLYILFSFVNNLLSKEQV